MSDRIVLSLRIRVRASVARVLRAIARRLHLIANRHFNRVDELSRELRAIERWPVV